MSTEMRRVDGHGTTTIRKQGAVRRTGRVRIGWCRPSSMVLLLLLISRSSILEHQGRGWLVRICGELVVSDDGEAAESVAALTRFLVGDATMQDTLTRVAELAVKAVPPAA